MSQEHAAEMRMGGQGWGEFLRFGHGQGSGEISLLSRFAVEDDVLTRLHDAAFGSVSPVLPWSERLARFSVRRVGAFDGVELVGFVHAAWDGGRHAFLLDTAVLSEYQRQGLGGALIAQLITDVRAAGCEWLHVDYEPHLRTFYEDACGFGRTEAGLLRLASVEAATSRTGT